MNPHSPRREEPDRRTPAAVAHDFNNALTPILAYAELLLYQPAAPGAAERWRAPVERIRAAAQRAVRLIRQLRDLTPRPRLVAVGWAPPPGPAPDGSAEADLANELNNVLAIIRGFGELEQRALPATDRRHGQLREIIAASRRAAALTRQLPAAQDHAANLPTLVVAGGEPRWPGNDGLMLLRIMNTTAVAAGRASAWPSGCAA